MSQLNEKVFNIFDKVHAEEELKKKTADYLSMEIRKREKARKRKGWKFAVAFASLAIFLLCGRFSYKIYFIPSAYIDIDVNPSIELTLNSFGRVIRSSAYNGDGERILNEVHVCYADYNDAVEKLLTAMAANGYFERDGLLSVTVQAKETSRESSILDHLQETIDTCSQNHHYHTVADVSAVTEEVKACANKEHLSPAKYLAIQDLLEIDSSASFKECRKHSIHELRQLVREHTCHHESEDTLQEPEDSSEDSSEESSEDSPSPQEYETAPEKGCHSQKHRRKNHH